MLRVPLCDARTPGAFTHTLALTPDHLELRVLGTDRLGPVRAELWDRDIRRRVAGGRRQPLARACGLHRDGAQRVLDATAGLGRDGAVLAALGCEVTLLERNPIVAALLEDGLRRAAMVAENQNWTARMRLVRADAIHHMQAEPSPPHEVVFLDPMYPARRKTALPSKEMQVLRAIAGNDDDAAQILQAALAYASRRVVVKRPPAGALLADHRPDLQYKGKAARYDVYFTRRAPARGPSGSG